MAHISQFPLKMDFCSASGGMHSLPGGALTTFPVNLAHFFSALGVHPQTMPMARDV